MTTIFVDEHTKKLLNEVKKEMLEKGYRRATYNDAIKYLYFHATGKLDADQRK